MTHHFPGFASLATCLGRTALVVLSLFMASAPATTARAQGQPRGGQVIEVTRFTGLKGQLVAARPGMIHWTDSSDKPFYVKILPTTYVQVLGQADPDFLRPGLLVRFSGEIQGRGTMAEPIEELTIFTPREGYVIGIYNDGDDPTRTDGPKLVAGRLKSIKNGKLIVVAGDQQVKAELAEEPTIKVDINDYSLAATGDEITVSGLGFEQDKIEATGIEIQLTERLTSGKKKRPRPGQADSKTRPADDDR